MCEVLYGPVGCGLVCDQDSPVCALFLAYMRSRCLFSLEGWVHIGVFIEHADICGAVVLACDLYLHSEG